MTDRAFAFRAELTACTTLLKRLLKDKRGVAAVEFAFIVPVLLCMYFVSMEVVQGINTDKKVSRMANLVGDLITQQNSITKSDVDSVMQIGSALLAPYTRSNPTIIVTAIQVTNDSALTPKVIWSRKLQNNANGQDAAAGTTTTLPAVMKTAGSFVIRVNAQLAYKPVVTWAASGKQVLGLTSAFDGIAMSETFYERSRQVSPITCPDC